MAVARFLKIAVGSVVLLAVGFATGLQIARHGANLNDFARTMQLHQAVADSMASGCSDKTTLQLLDIYEHGVRRQLSYFGNSGFDWKQQLMLIELRRYIIYLSTDKADLAEGALTRAATFMKKGPAPTKEEIEFCRQVATRLYSPKP